MILDEVLEEEVIYTEDSMVDMFVEGFLYALEMQEEGKKASSMEELSNTLSEAAVIAISELSDSKIAKAYGKATQIQASAHQNYSELKNHVKKNKYNSNNNTKAMVARSALAQAKQVKDRADRHVERLSKKIESRNKKGIHYHNDTDDYALKHIY